MLECAVRWAVPVDEPPMRALLDDRERDRYDRFIRAEDKARFVTGRFLARTVLADLEGLAPESIRFTTDCPHCGGTHGKPRLPGSDLDFSLSHSGDRVVLVLAEGAEVGVDVERRATATSTASPRWSSTPPNARPSPPWPTGGAASTPTGPARRPC